MQHNTTMSSIMMRFKAMQTDTQNRTSINPEQLISDEKYRSETIKRFTDLINAANEFPLITDKLWNIYLIQNSSLCLKLLTSDDSLLGLTCIDRVIFEHE